MKIFNRRNFSAAKIIIFGYAAIIAVGTLLLCLPISSVSRTFTPLSDAFFTSVSASCVTGLAVFDTYTYWSLFGQLVILTLIQIGGIGFMTFAVTAMTFTGKKIGLKERYVMQESVSATQVGGIVKTTKFILSGTIIFELLGALALLFSFVPEFGISKGIYFSLFHSISAFCNAGFDLMGTISPGSSLCCFADDVIVNITIPLLVIIGGIGFLTWDDVYKNKLHFKKYKLTTKVILLCTLVLTLSSTALIFLLEYNGQAFGNMNTFEKLLASFFQAVSPRTAGFASVNLADFSGATKTFMQILMTIGAAPGSTGGGAKITTVFLLLIGTVAEIRDKNDIECFGRRISDRTLRKAACIFMCYVLFSVSGAIAISFIEGISMELASFETFSATCTVGLSLGITSGLGTVSKLILCALMFFGRAGGITLFLAFGKIPLSIPSKLPEENITV